MRREYFEILTLLASGNEEQIGHLYWMYTGYSHKDYPSFEEAVRSVVLYGLVERVNKEYPLICNRTYLKISEKGLKALDFYEPKFYKGTEEGLFIDSEFLGR